MGTEVVLKSCCNQVNNCGIISMLLSYSPHPYIFFNQDGMSITFVGFTVTKQGDLLNPTNQQVLEPAIMHPRLYTGLITNRVNFQDDYRSWKKPVMIEKLATVMGVEYPHDPDETYVLTVDNVIKILAIQMRFRQEYMHTCLQVRHTTTTIITLPPCLRTEI